MSETLNVNVLVAAKEEYTKQLIYILSPEIYDVILNVFRESQQYKKKSNVSLKNFQIQLKKIPTWNNIIIEKNTLNIKTKIPYLLDLITAIFVSHVKILACVRLKSSSKSIQVKVPNLDTFIHKIIITNAEKIYYNPQIILEKKEKVIFLISDTIEETIRNQIPLDKILTEYLEGVFEQSDDIDESNKTSRIINNYNEGNDNDDNSDADESEAGESEADESEADESEAPDDINKNIVPTRPLPESQLFGNHNIPTNPEDINKETTDNVINNIPTQDIKNKVLFKDAMEKKFKSKNDESESDESDNDDLQNLTESESEEEEED